MNEETIDLTQYISDPSHSSSSESPKISAAEHKRLVRQIKRQLGIVKRAGAWSPKKPRNQKRR